MEKAAMVSDTRGFDITRDISLRKQLPVPFLQLATRGFCEIDLAEWMFDLDYPNLSCIPSGNVTQFLSYNVRTQIRPLP